MFTQCYQNRPVSGDQLAPPTAFFSLSAFSWIAFFSFRSFSSLAFFSAAALTFAFSSRSFFSRRALLAATCVWKSNFGRPTPSTRCCLRSCVCSMAWSFQAMDATLSPVTASVRWRGGSRSPRNISQDNLTHWLISTQARGPRAAPDARARVPPARPGRRREADDEPLRHVRPAHAAVPRRRHHHGAGRSPLADREALALALADGVPGPSADA